MARGGKGSILAYLAIDGTPQERRWGQILVYRILPPEEILIER
jgi:hypothetical protein